MPDAVYPSVSRVWCPPPQPLSGSMVFEKDPFSDHFLAIATFKKLQLIQMVLGVPGNMGPGQVQSEKSSMGWGWGAAPGPGLVGRPFPEHFFVFQQTVPATWTYPARDPIWKLPLRWGTITTSAPPLPTTSRC